MMSELLVYLSVGLGVGMTVRTICIIIGSLMQFAVSLTRAVIGV